MNESGNARSEAYNRLRQEFDSLAVEDKAIFLLESTMTTMVRGIESFGRMIGDELERILNRAEEAAAEAEAEAEAEAAAEAAAGAPAPNVTPEAPGAAGPVPPENDIPGPRSPKKGPSPRDEGEPPIV